MKTQNQTQQCYFCNSELVLKNKNLNEVICNQCGHANQVQKSLFAKHKPAFILFSVFILVGLSTLAYHKYNQSKFEANIARDGQPVPVDSEISQMSAVKLETKFFECQQNGNLACQINVYRRYVELEPENDEYLANLAIRLTMRKLYAEADPLYQKVLSHGTATYDMLAYYGMNLESQNKLEEAIKIYEKTLSIQPSLVDIVQKLAKLYLKTGEAYTAVSLMESYVNQYPKMRNYLQGDIIAMTDQAGHAEPKNSVTLAGTNEGHVNIPIQLAEDAKPEIFLIDTGASLLSMPTKDIEKTRPALCGKPESAILQLADGRRIPGQIVCVKEIIVGPWKLNNIQVAYCENCERLAGMSVLRQFKIETSTQGQLFKMKLSR